MISAPFDIAIAIPLILIVNAIAKGY